MTDPIQKIKGFADLFGSESAKFTRMETLARDVFSRYGFQEARIPLLEKTELFARSIGTETDVVQKEMYSFDDRKGRSLTLRPEATAGMLRAYIENKLYTSDAVSKFFTFGPMFRYERPQKGRMRQFHQLDVEILGTHAPQADAELICMLWNFLDGLELQGIALEINSLGCKTCRPAFHDNLRSFLRTIDQTRLCPDCNRRAQTNPLRVLDCKQAQCKELLTDAPLITDNLCPQCAEHFAQVRRVLDQANLPYTLNHLLVRGLDYYQRTTFEFVSGHIGSQSAVAGGGRYDGLIESLGGPDIPGIGFACGMERLALLMPELQSSAPDFYLAVLTENALARALQIGEQLRQNGLQGEVAFEAKSIKSQMRQANKTKARFALLLGEEELNTDTIIIKDMAEGTQQQVAVHNLCTCIQEQKINQQ